MKVLLFLLISLALAQQGDPGESAQPGTSDDAPFEIGQATKLHPGNITHEFKAVSYNIRWRGGKSLQELAQALKTDPEIGGASLLALQEVDRNKSRTDNVNTAKILAEELGMHYAWTAPPNPKAGDEEETGVLILSAYPLSEVTKILLPHDGPNHRRRMALGATVTIGDNKIRFYSVHAETRLPVQKKLEQFKTVLDDLSKQPRDMPAIIMGDFNTWEMGIAGKVKKLFENAGFKTPFNGDATFVRRVLIEIELRLDWIWLRNLESTASGIDTKITFSDHWPLWVALKIKPVRR